MKIAIVHYHLGPGGVTQSILSSSKLLDEKKIPHVILTGVAYENSDAFPTATVNGLDYVSRCPHARGITARELEQSMRRTACSHLGTPPDLWHIHNHSLGKNPKLTEAVSLLAEAGEHLILHIHDLAEDGRPALYSNIRHLENLYPTASHIHYAFLNQRDLDHFLAAGLPRQRASLLPAIPQQLTRQPHPPPKSSPPLLFAPIRGIRRKNLGELALLSVLLPPPARIAISRPPTDPESLRIHDTWQSFAKIHAPRLRFQVTDRIPPVPGAACDFHSWVSYSTHLVGTSICEGFGLPFLEARLWGRSFIGRSLPHLEHLVDPDSTYDRLLIPAEWVPQNMLREALDTGLARDDRHRRSSPRRPFLSSILDHLTKDPWLDFGNLPEPMQQSAIERCSDPEARAQVRVRSNGTISPAIPWLIAKTAYRDPSAYRPVILPTADPTPIYRNLSGSPASQIRNVPPARILSQYHNPSTFHFLTSPPAPPSAHRLPYQVVLFDIYGTLLHTANGPVQPALDRDPAIAQMLERLACDPPLSPTTALYEAIRRHHDQSPEDHPEVDLAEIWRSIIHPPPTTDLDRLVIATEDIRSPSRPIDGAFEAVRRLSQSGVRMGILSNAQRNAMHHLQSIGGLFDPELILLSYQWGVAKPSRLLFEEMSARLERADIPQNHVLYIGNSSTQDIAPAQSQGWHTAHFSAKVSTTANITFQSYPALLSWLYHHP